MQKTYKKNQPETIRSLFDQIAGRYELGNACLSFCLYRLWNRALIKRVITPKRPESYLDLCAGTGEISLVYLKRSCRESLPKKSYLLDFSSEMLLVAKEKEKRWGLPSERIEYLEADAQEIPLPSSSVDCVTAAYGIRNLKEPSRCFEESYRVLRGGGVFGMLELTRPKNPLLRAAHGLYLKTALPLVGSWVTSNREAYEYLCETVRTLIPPEELVGKIERAGFREVSSISLFGGIATLIKAEKTHSA